jgi:hypothetical protein
VCVCVCVRAHVCIHAFVYAPAVYCRTHTLDNELVQIELLAFAV